MKVVAGSPALGSMAAVAALSFAFGTALADQAADKASVPNEPHTEKLEVVTVLTKRLGMERPVDAAKLPVPLIDLPQSVTIIDRALLDDQNAVLLQDALRNAGGVIPGGYFQGFDYYRIRGFDSSGFTFLDGLTADQTFWTQEELFGIEHVEVLKGPVSGLFGQSPAGGLVNLVSKRPQHDSFLKLQTSVGSYDYLDVGIDGNTELGDSVTLRTNALYRKHGSFVDNVPTAKRYFLAPALTWDISDKTHLTLLTQFISEDTGLAQPLPAEGTVLPNPGGTLPRTRAIGEPGFDDTANIRRRQGGWDFTHEFNDTLSFHQVARASSIDVDFQAIYPWYLDTEDLRTLYRYARKQKVEATAYTGDNQFIAKLDSGGVKHTLLAGADYYRFDQLQGFAYYSFSGPGLAPIDIFNPQYGTVVPDFSVQRMNPTRLVRVGTYVQDYVELTDRLAVLVGGRYDWTDDGNAKDKKFTPRAGVTFKVVPGAVLFASYSKSFLPQAGYETAAGDPLPPETGDQYEIGLKTELFEDRLSGTVSVYQLTRQNIATDDPGSEEYVFITSGEQRARGIEIDGVVRITPTWEVVADYAYTDAKVTRDNELVVDSRTANIPKNALSLWSKYVVADGLLRGVGFSAGVRHYTKQAGDLTYVGAESDAFELPGYTIYDAGVSYDGGRYQVRLNLSNLTDKRYFPASSGRTFVMPGDPRSYRLGVSYDF
ncbi:MAG: TonB-dependent siderophore receptor [Gammaproteobacteria bacterium]